jgi:hypothetical protein
MKLEEIRSFIPHTRCTERMLIHRLHSPRLSEHVSYHSGYYFFRDRSPYIIEQRKRNEAYAAHRWKTAKLMTRIIRFFPFVRGVMISGELSKNVSKNNSDIDYFIVTAPHRIWIARTLLILFKKIFLLNKKKYFCLNYFRTNDDLVFTRYRDFYLAVEIITLTPLYNVPVYEKIMEQNPWLSEFFPNYRFKHRTHNGDTKTGQSKIQHILEILLEQFNLDKWDTRLMEVMKKVWRRRYPHLNQTELEKRFICTNTESSAFPDESYGVIMEYYTRRYLHMRRRLLRPDDRSELSPSHKSITTVSINP